MTFLALIVMHTRGSKAITAVISATGGQRIYIFLTSFYVLHIQINYLYLLICLCFAADAQCAVISRRVKKWVFYKVLLVSFLPFGHILYQEFTSERL